MSVQPCQVSRGITRRIVKVLVNKAHVLSSSRHIVGLEVAKSLTWINGGGGGSANHQALAEDHLNEIWGPFFSSWRAVYDSAATGADNDQLWASLTELLGDLVGTLKYLIMTLYRCHLCHLWDFPRWPPMILWSWQSGHRQALVGGPWAAGLEERAGPQPRVDWVNTEQAAAALHSLFFEQLFCTSRFPQIVWEDINRLCKGVHVHRCLE